MTYLITALFVVAALVSIASLIGSYRRAFKAARELSRPRPKPDNPLTRQWIPPIPQEPTK